MGEFVVASPGRPLPCPGQDLDDRLMPVHGLFHSEWLAQERFTFAEPTLVGCHRSVRFLVRSNFGGLNVIVGRYLLAILGGPNLRAPLSLQVSETATFLLSLQFPRQLDFTFKKLPGAIESC
jgi:hypothetical protein